MKRRILNLLLGFVAMLAVNVASASLLGHSTELVLGGSISPINANTTTAIAGGGIEYDVCVNGPVGCATGLRVQIDIGALGIKFLLSGTTGAIGSGDTFNLEIDFLDFVPPESITGASPGKFILGNGELQFDSAANASIAFAGVETGGGAIGVSELTTLAFNVDFVGAAVPEPATFALLALTLAGMAMLRRPALRIAR